jgi:hypothetical protein
VPRIDSLSNEYFIEASEILSGHITKLSNNILESETFFRNLNKRSTIMLGDVDGSLQIQQQYCSRKGSIKRSLKQSHPDDLT